MIYNTPSIDQQFVKNIYYLIDCLTKGGEDPGAQCQFPWFYSKNGMNYTGCANPHNDPKGNWCPTELDGNGEMMEPGKWGYCSHNCPKHQGSISK